MTYQHIKRQSLYDALGTIRVQSDKPVLDNDQLILYRAREDGLLWGRPPIEFFDSERFKPMGPIVIEGHRVSKHSGYPFPGEVRSVFWNRAGQRRYVIEATGADYAGMLHIFSPEQLVFHGDIDIRLAQ